MPTADPFPAGAREVLDLALREMRECVDGLTAEVLNWRPAGEGTNSIAVLAVHSLSSTRSWLSVALGAPLPERDRPSEFVATTEGVVALLSFVDAMQGDCVSLLDGARDVDWSAQRRAHTRPGDAPEPDVVAAWALMHALSHLREHVGQMLLTRQLSESR